MGAALIALTVMTSPVDALDRADALRPWSWHRGIARNVIIMVSDGCGFNHVDATSLWETGSLETQVYEYFPVRCGVSTYSAGGDGYEPEQARTEFAYVQSGYTDSAAAATAMSTGKKTNNGMVGVAPDGSPLEHAIEFAETLGKATGVVTTVPFSHATPAGFVAHNLSRNNYEAIGRYMVRDSAVDVIMGCGHPWYDNDGEPSIEADFGYVGGEDTWAGLTGGTLGADADGDGITDPWLLVEERAAFQSLASGPTPKRVIGVPQVRTTLQQRRSGASDADPFVVPLNESVPTLAEMTAAALNVLGDDPEGFLLMVEGGAVDWASHANQSGRMIEEQVEFGQAVSAVLDWVGEESSWRETLVIVTADHETGYLLGPGSDPEWRPLEGSGAGGLPGMEWHSTQHTNSLVPLFAVGAGSWLLWQSADEYDPVRGLYLDNTEIGEALFLVMSPRGWQQFLWWWRSPRVSVERPVQPATGNSVRGLAARPLGSSGRHGSLPRAPRPPQR